MKKIIVVLTLIAIFAAPLWAQDEQSFLFKPNRDRSGVVIDGYGGSEKNVKIPAMIQGMPVTEISPRAFRTLPITSVVIPRGVTIIGEAAFIDCKQLYTVTLPNTLKTIGRDAFRNCEALTSIDLPEGITDIQQTAFANTGLRSVKWPASAPAISEYVFRECSNLETVTLPEGLITIGNGAFYRCAAITSINIPSTVRNIYNLSFSGCIAIPMNIQVAIQRAGYKGNFK